MRYAKCQVLKDIDIAVIKGRYEGKINDEIAEELYTVTTNIRYHINKIKRITGLNPYVYEDVKKLYAKYVEGKSDDEKNLAHNRA